MKVIIDRFEGEFAVVEIEVGKYVSVPRILFPNAKEGDVIKFEIDSIATEERNNKVEELINKVFED